MQETSTEKDLDIETIRILFDHAAARAEDAPEAADADSASSPGIPAHLEELYPRCVELVRGTGKANTSLLQRKFHIGYARAAMLMDMLETRGGK